MNKTCFACKESKPAGEFYVNKQKKDGLSSYCKPCHIAKKSSYYVAHPKVRLDGLKRCPQCGDTKPLSDFHNNKRSHDGLASYCKPCSVNSVRAYHQRNPQKHRDYNRNWDRANPGRKADSQLKTKYGIEPGSYDRMFKKQNGRCAICSSITPGKKEIRFHVDHCHDTGKVRALLCSSCNTGIGQFRHDENLLLKAVDYLRLHA